MTVSSKRAHLLLSAGLGTALAESDQLPCSKQAGLHGNQHRQGYRFCHYCGQKLEVIGKCEECGEEFLSPAAFYVHTHGLISRYKRCPVHPGHSVRYLKRRRKFFCVGCQKEI